MTFEDLKKANESVNMIEVSKKKYAPVNERIKAFRMLYPEGFIRTMMVSNEDGVCVFRAEVGYRTFIAPVNGGLECGDEVILATGTAYEVESSSFINKTSFIENCETSAVGRALGMLGIGIDTSVASAEEVDIAIQKQERIKQKISKESIDLIRQMAKDSGIDLNGILKKRLENFNEAEADELIQRLGKVVPR